MGNLEKTILRLQKKDLTAFDAFYNETRKPVYFMVFSILQDHSKSEDICQDFYIKILNKVDTYSPGTNAFAWLMQIAKNLALNEKVKESKVVLVDVSQNEALFGGYSINYDLKTPILDLAIKNLSKEDFQIVSLIAISGYKRREVSQALNMPIGTITWRYNEALKKLKELITLKGGNGNGNK